MEETQKGLEGIGGRVHGLQSGVKTAAGSLAGVRILAATPSVCATSSVWRQNLPPPQLQLTT
eukprot:955385-Amphidinium_carterae.3